MAQYKSPNDSLIVGTAELVPGVAAIIDIGDDGEPEYGGGTEMDWDNQRGIEDGNKDGKIVYVDELGCEWYFSNLTKVVEESD